MVSGLPKNHKKSNRLRLTKRPRYQSDRADPTPMAAETFVLVLGKVLGRPLAVNGLIRWVVATNGASSVRVGSLFIFA